MGIAVVLFFHVVLFVVLLIVFRGLAVLLAKLIRPSNTLVRAAFWILPLILAAIPISLFSLAILWGNIAPPRDLFAQVFHVEPGPDILGLQGSSSATSDAAHIVLAFRAPPKTVRSLTAEGFRPLDEQEARELVPLHISPRDLPGWWKAGACDVRTVLAAKDKRPWEDIVVTLCASDGRTYVEAFWLD